MMKRVYCSVPFCFYVLSLIHSYQIGAKAFVVVRAIETAPGSVFTSSTNNRVVRMGMSDKTIELEKETSEFHQYAAAAVDLSSCHMSSRSVLSVLRSTRNWELETRQNYLYRFNLVPLLTGTGDNEALGDEMQPPPIPLDSSVQLYLPSPSGLKTVVIKIEHKDGSESDERVVEIWKGSSLTRRIQIGGKDSHGKIVNDPTGFGIPSWSPDEECLLYSAERLPPTTVPFWTKAKNVVENDTKESTIDGDLGGQNVLGQGQTETWGECYSKQEAILDLYILNVSTGRLGRVRNIPDAFDETKATVLPPNMVSPASITLGQAVWHPNGSKIAFTGWSSGQPKRLGMVYCKNRASKIYVSEVETLLQDLAKTDGITNNDEVKVENVKNSDISYTCVSSDLSFSRSPRFVRGEDGEENLVFLASDRPFVSHDACMGLYRWDENSQATKNVVPIFENPSTNGPKVLNIGFPGLFLGQLPVNCNIGKNFLVTSTLWGSFQRVIRVNIKNGNIQLIDIPQLNRIGSHSLCTVGPSGDLIISETSCDQPASLWLVKNEAVMQEATQGSASLVANAQLIVSFSPIAASTFSSVGRSVERPYNMKVLSIDTESIDGAEPYPIQALLLLPKLIDPSDKVPMIVIPHGGPHSCSTSSFSPGIAYLANKYAVLLPNYRGSTGFGQAPLSSLLTRIGRVDVEDVMQSIKYVIENFSVVDCQRIGICGGSHGGFLTAHCTSQYPEFFKAAAMRNPVTNIASMVTSTDIPDWCYGEIVGEYDQSLFRGPTSNQLLKMYEKSPVSLVHEVKTPTLIALGLVDLRVPPTQGLEWFYSLRSLGVPTKLLKYPKDCHSLNLVTTEVDHWMHIRRWFDSYL